MKKILLTLLCTFTFLSCSNSNEDTDIIVGTWGLFSINNVEVSDCEKMSTITFNLDGSTTGTTYMINNNICAQQGVNDITTWVNNRNNIYIISPNTSNALEWKIVFSDNNNTMDIVNEGVIYKRQ